MPDKRELIQHDGASPQTYESIQFLGRILQKTISARHFQYVGEVLDWPCKAPELSILKIICTRNTSLLNCVTICPQN